MRARAPVAATPGAVLQALVDADLANLPLPGRGATLQRWRMLSAVAAHDLSLAKLYEAHADAHAILAELGAPMPAAGSTWGVWCAEAPDARLHASVPSPDGTVTLHGVKAWCSGAASLSHALVSAWSDEGEPVLAAVALDQPGVAVGEQGWQAVGMAATASVDVRFNAARGVQIGFKGDYLSRPGFWHGGAGIAACWYGAVAALGEALRTTCLDKAGRAAHADTVDAGAWHRQAHLGATDVALSSAAAVLHDVAAWIDRHPEGDARLMALRARLVVEDAATRVLQAVPRALGAGPLCRDAHIAHLVADLPVFMRQSHAERDQATLGSDLMMLKETPWPL
jgi:hypothetical protein